MKLYNRNFAIGERIEYMGWVNEGVINCNISWQTYKPRFLILKGTEVMLFDSPPVIIMRNKICHCLNFYKFYVFVVERCRPCKANQCLQSVSNYVSNNKRIRNCRCTATLFFTAELTATYNSTILECRNTTRIVEN